MALTVSNDDLFVVEVNILDPEAEAFHKPEARTVEQAPHNELRAGEMAKNGLYFELSEHNREAGGFFSPLDFIDPGEVLPKHISVEE